MAERPKHRTLGDHILDRPAFRRQRARSEERICALKERRSATPPRGGSPEPKVEENCSRLACEFSLLMAHGKAGMPQESTRNGAASDSSGATGATAPKSVFKWPLVLRDHCRQYKMLRDGITKSGTDAWQMHEFGIAAMEILKFLAGEEPAITPTAHQLFVAKPPCKPDTGGNSWKAYASSVMEFMDAQDLSGNCGMKLLVGQMCNSVAVNGDGDLVSRQLVAGMKDDIVHYPQYTCTLTTIAEFQKVKKGTIMRKEVTWKLAQAALAGDPSIYRHLGERMATGDTILEESLEVYAAHVWFIAVDYLELSNADQHAFSAALDLSPSRLQMRVMEEYLLQVRTILDHERRIAGQRDWCQASHDYLIRCYDTVLGVLASKE